MRVSIKICGITTVDDALAAVHAGANAVGLVFAESPRQVNLDTARAIISVVPPFVATVAVFRYPRASEVARVVAECAPDLVQSEPAAAVRTALPPGIRLLPVLHEGEDDLWEMLYRVTPHTRPGLLLEAAGRGGRGVAPDWDVAARIARETPLILAGGLTPANVGDALHRVRPWAVDVSSGVEITPGVKDFNLVAEFVAAVRRAEESLKTELTK